MIATLEGLFRRFWRLFSPFEWMRRLLNLSQTTDAASAPGLVMIQIDGLGYSQMNRGMQEGNMPFLTRLLKKERYINRRHYSGIPSNTPAVQGRLFYGVKSCVPAFSFKDKETGKVFNMFNPEFASTIENRIKDQGEPLLKDGSSYGNIFTGGAKEAHFCASSIGWGGLLKAAHPFGAPLTILLNIHIFLRALVLIVIEFVLSTIDFIRGIISGKNFMHEMQFVLLRVAVCVFLREVVATGARIDIARGLPVVHINLAGYDEQAHHRGPSSRFAHWSLRGIDSVVAKVWKAAQKSRHRHYEVFIYSDHGQEDTIGYQTECGQSDEDAVNSVLKEHISSRQWRTEFSHSVPYWRSELLRNKPRQYAPPVSKDEKDASPLAVVTSLGPVGHIYLPEKFSSDEKEKLALRLIDMAKIPIVMVADGKDRAIAWNAKGKFSLPEEADKVIETNHPFYKEVVRDLVELCHHPNAGELIMLGWRAGRKSLTFHTELGSHAGPGPEETSGFALLPMGTLPRCFGETVYTQDIRDAAFRVQDRVDANAPEKPRNTMISKGPVTLKVMTYNVHSCRGRDGKVSPQRIAGIIAKHDPDIIALQELAMKEQSQQVEIIARKMDMAYQFHPTLSVRKGHRGNAILSKYPMRLVRNGNLPRLARNRLLEARAAMWVELDVCGTKLHVFNTHLSLSSIESMMQMKALCGPEWLGSPVCRGPVLFCGDLNASSTSRICKLLGQTLKNTQFELANHQFSKTLPSFYPISLVDHVFVKEGIKTLSIEVPDSHIERIASDHLPLIVEVLLEPLDNNAS